MRLTLTIGMDNAAFGDPYREHELARILRWAADKLEGGSLDASLVEGLSLRDCNGNRVGELKVEN